MFRSIELSDLWTTSSQKCLFCARNETDISMLKCICDYSICLHNQKKKNSKSRLISTSVTPTFTAKFSCIRLLCNCKITGLFGWEWFVHCPNNGKQRNSTISNIWYYWTFDCSCSAWWQISSHGNFYFIFTINEGKKFKKRYWNYAKRTNRLSYYTTLPPIKWVTFTKKRKWRSFPLRTDLAVC